MSCSLMRDHGVMYSTENLWYDVVKLRPWCVLYLDIVWRNLLEIQATSDLIFGRKSTSQFRLNSGAVCGMCTEVWTVHHVCAGSVN